jgi:cellulose synthase/poly-beta-1,6-N-acetylglucosamine synthase-like glycosyltransferase
MISILAWSLIAVCVLLVGYAYAGYPLVLLLLARRKPADDPEADADWPTISITLPAYNEERHIGATLDALLAVDYPADRRQILVISDASTDGTDEIVRSYAERGVELLRLAERGGKGAAERAAMAHLRGEIVVNTDASIRVRPDALKPLIAAFRDAAVGVASGRDISVTHLEDDANAGESGYVSYEMKVRRLETRAGGIIGSSGCFYAVRAPLHRAALPPSVSRDFASALIARAHGYRAVSVDRAACLVPRTASLRDEYHRKVRTITRGMETLLFMRGMMNPFRVGRFAFMLLSHKVCRWLVPWTFLPAAVGLALLSLHSRVALALLSLGLLSALLALAGWIRSARHVLPRVLALPAFFYAGNLAAVHAGLRVLHGDQDAIWEPTRRAAPVAVDP